MVFEVKEFDKKYYQEHLVDFLPERMIDIHTHVWLDSMTSVPPETLTRVASWPYRVAKDNSIEDLMTTYDLLLPGKQITPMIFSSVIDKNNLEALNGYTAQCAKSHKFPSLAVTRPDWEKDSFERIILQGGFFGTKVYLTFSPEYIPTDEIRTYDFLPHHQLDVLNQHGWVVMLHIARTQRLRDPVNLQQLLEIEQRYPNIKLIVAHVGRAYCEEDIGNAFEVLQDTKKMVFDISANTNREVFKRLIDAVGPQRILFGSDLPITRMRMRRINENGRYINLVPKGLYGDVSNDSNMREVDGEEADRLTYFLYEQLNAFRKAAAYTKLTPKDIEDIFFTNAANMIGMVE